MDAVGIFLRRKDRKKKSETGRMTHLPMPLIQLLGPIIRRSLRTHIVADPEKTREEPGVLPCPEELVRAHACRRYAKDLSDHMHASLSLFLGFTPRAHRARRIVRTPPAQIMSTPPYTHARCASSRVNFDVRILRETFLETRIQLILQWFYGLCLQPCPTILQRGH